MGCGLMDLVADYDIVYNINWNGDLIQFQHVFISGESFFTATDTDCRSLGDGRTFRECCENALGGQWGIPDMHMDYHHFMEGSDIPVEVLLKEAA
jgi:hypothetical protein